ncbi:MAG: CapA family protein [Actinomycetota bacterium]|nr:CapA family protein [Actinomycetota bacterium]
MGRHTRKRSPGSATLALGSLAVLAVVIVVVVALVQPDPTSSSDGARPNPSETPDRTSTGPFVAPTTTATPTPTPPPGVTLAFAGDVHFTGRTQSLLDDPASAFGPIADTLSAADIAMVNLETAITERGDEEPKQFHFRTPPVALDALSAAGIDVASLANNHAVDYGPAGLDDTLAAIEQGTLPVVGVGRDAASAYAPYRTEVRGTAISIFAVSQVQDRTYAAWTATDDSAGIASTADRARLLTGVRQATRAGDVVIVYVHWGIEGDPCPTNGMAALATDLAAAGADAIVGTHAHLLLGAGYLDQPGSTAYVAYGLGNFLWWRAQASSDDTGVLTLSVAHGSVVEAEFTPALIDDVGRPQPVLGPQALAKHVAFEELRECAGLLAAPAR